MKPARTILILFIGAIIGVAATIGYNHFRRAQAIRALPSLADRNHPPNIDELSFVILSRRNGQIEYDVRDGMVGKHKDFQTLLAFERQFSNSDPLWIINFEAGVTSDDLDATVQQLSELGVKHYFIGNSIYGKAIPK